MFNATLCLMQGCTDWGHLYISAKLCTGGLDGVVLQCGAVHCRAEGVDTAVGQGGGGGALQQGDTFIFHPQPALHRVVHPPSIN